MRVLTRGHRSRMRATALIAVAVVEVAVAAVLVQAAEPGDTGAATITAPVGLGSSAGGAPAAGSAAGTARRGVAAGTPCPAFGFSAPSEWNSADAELDRVMTAAVRAGGRSVRVGLEWDRIEARPGVFDWSSADRQVRAARAHGLSVVGLLHTTPAWARAEQSAPGNRHHPPRDPGEYAAFAAAAARRYHAEVHTWELWNEPNIADFWYPQTDPPAYARLIRAAYPAVKAADPGATVLAGSMAPSPDTPWSASPEVFLQTLYAAGAGGDFDAVSQHAYQGGPGSGDALDPLRLTHRIMADHGDGDSRIWVTELGMSTGVGERTVTPAAQARGLSAAVRRAATLPWVGPLFVYTVRDRDAVTGDAESAFGVYTHALAPKPAVGELRALADAATCPAADTTP